MKNIISKLMVVMAMSFVVSNTSAFAKDASEIVKEATKAVTASQREIHKHGIGIGLGQTFLLGNFEKKGDDKIGADFLYTYTASYSFDLMLNAHYSKHEYRGKAVWLRGYTMSIKARSYEYDAFSPFLLGGLGFYMPQIKDSDGKTSEGKYTFGFNIGGGVDLRLNKKIVTGVIAQYHQPFEVKQDETENIRGSYFKLLLTVMYLF
ncbi:MAG: opacity protein-like surface antigen [Bacteriovoracaceae bacterium]|jgi:opacity protein-like surface antigen